MLGIDLRGNHVLESNWDLNSKTSKIGSKLRLWSLVRSMPRKLDEEPVPATAPLLIVPVIRQRTVNFNDTSMAMPPNSLAATIWR